MITAVFKKPLIIKLLIIACNYRMCFYFISFYLQNGADDVKRHRWFKGLDWEEVYYRKLKPPIIPKVSYDGDTCNFDEYPEADWQRTPCVSEKDYQLFDNF